MIARRTLLRFASVLPFAFILHPNWKQENLNCTIPKFAIDQRVVHEWTVTDEGDERYGQVLRDEGIIIGMIWNSPDWSDKGWVYFTKWVKYETWSRDPGLYIGHVDEVHENDLKEPL